MRGLLINVSKAYSSTYPEASRLARVQTHHSLGLTLLIDWVPIDLEQTFDLHGGRRASRGTRTRARARAHVRSP
eukprot:49779-Prymnesium_polylepis.1